ncbi:hypothetical protein [Lysobacter sp. CA199]|uniref:hypothetical protein n=1 Tax=Lysobacter sp. CA199 TaxID=3455608 RepID=UPI003F8D1ED6
MIKWIDGYRQAHKLSRSPAVDVLFQQVTAQHPADIRRLDAPRLLRKPVQREGERIYQLAQIHVGSLPYVRIGQVFREKELVGTLPLRSQRVTLTNGEASARSVSCADELPRPSDWEWPFRVLNPSQFELPRELWRSRCLLYRDEDLNADIVIPRTLIEQTFYFPHTEIANAFACGPWDHIKHGLIYLGEMESGLKTGIDPETGAWNIIIETKVLDQYAPLMALFHFDGYAERCARSLYGHALQDRGSDAWAPWYASGKIPFERSVSLNLRGHWLQYVERKGSRTFLATHIESCNWPSHLPAIQFERRNSGAGSEEPIKTLESRPYSERQSSRRGPDGTLLSSMNNASTASEAHAYEGIGLSWDNGLRVTKLTKRSSKQYDKGNPFSTNAEPREQESTGASTSESSADHKALMESRQMASAHHFSYLLANLEALRNEGAIEHFFLVEPTSGSARADRSGITCWNFLDDRMRRTGRTPGRGWIILNPASKRNTRHPRLTPRAALVVEIRMRGVDLLWFEIERRETESGMCSPALIEPPAGGLEEIVDHCLQAIALAQGRAVREVISTMAADYPPMRCDFYQHTYVRAQKKTDVKDEFTVNGLSAESIKSFLQRCTQRPILAAKGSEQD